MAKFYTGTGDAGQTSLYSGERRAKTDLRIEAYGTIDELQAFLGQARSFAAADEVARALLDVEELLMQVMAELATLEGEPRINGGHVRDIEEKIDWFTERLPEGFRWSVPGDSVPSAALHVARAVARRAERQTLRLAAAEDVGVDLLVYLNRISDLCYALARYQDEVVGAEE